MEMLCTLILTLRIEYYAILDTLNTKERCLMIDRLIALCHVKDYSTIVFLYAFAQA